MESTISPNIEAASHGYQIIRIKNESPDFSSTNLSSNDKVLQFKLALQRQSEKAVITIEEVPIEKETGSIHFVDLTLSDDEDNFPLESCIEAPTTTNGNYVSPSSPSPSSYSEISHDTLPFGMSFENSHRLDETGNIFVNSTTEDNEEDEYEVAMSAVEVSLDEPLNSGETLNGIHGDECSYDGVDTIDSTSMDYTMSQIQQQYRRRPPRFSIPKRRREYPAYPGYTADEKRAALNGNPTYDYRTRINPVTGIEEYAIYKCLKCPTGFPRMFHLQTHERGHGLRNTAGYKCDYCDFSAANTLLLRNHLERHRLQTDPSLFANMNERPKTGFSPPESDTTENLNKRRYFAESFGGIKKSKIIETPSINTSTTVGSESPNIGSTSPNGTSLSLSSTSGLSHTRDERFEARLGNPTFVYKNGTRYNKNGKVYARTSYKCKLCPYSCEKFNLLLHHQKGHKERRKYRCGVCTYSTCTIHHMEKHTRFHNFQFGTEVTTQGFSSTTPTDPDMKTDYTGAQSDDETANIIEETGDPNMKTRSFIQCNKCPSWFSGSGNMSIHKRQHGRMGLRFVCPYCDYASNREDYINKHIEAHTGKRPILPTYTSTPTCHPSDLLSVTSMSSTFESASSLETEDENSVDNSAFQPNISEDEYDRLIKGNPLFTYITVNKSGNPVPTEKSFKCWHCPFATTKYASYLSHAQCHGANSKYKCVICNYTAKTYRGMKNHQLAHKIQHPNSPNLISSVEEIQEPESSNPSPSEFVLPIASMMVEKPSESVEKSQLGQFFISTIKIMNIMPMNLEKATGADVADSGILKLKGETEQGKSSFILAVMLGFGYDLFLDVQSSTSICGLNLRNIISEGKKFATIDLTLSLHAFPELQKDFGTHLKLHRRLTREPTPLSNMIVVSSADTQCKTTIRPKLLGMKEMEVFLHRMKLSPERLRLMLLDGENIKYMMDNSHLWYSFLEAAAFESKSDIEIKIEETNFLLQRLHNNEKWKQVRIECLKTQVDAHPPLETEEMLKMKENDWVDLNNFTEEVIALAKEREALQQKLQSYLDQVKGNTEDYVTRMRTVFSKFLSKVNYAGDIIVCNEKKILSLCVRKLNGKEPPPTTVDEVDGIWKSMSNGKRRLGVIALYLAFWEISSYLQVFAADAYSCTETDFKVPPLALPVLWDLVNEKCLERKQCIISLPPNY